MSLSIGGTSSSIGDGLSPEISGRLGIPSFTDSTLDESIDEWLSINSKTLADTIVSPAKVQKVDDESKDESTDFEKLMSDLTGKVVKACKALTDSPDQSDIDQVVTVHHGLHKSLERGVITTHRLQVAGFNRNFKLIINGITPPAIAELFAALYYQWKWWDERVTFIQPHEISMGKLAKAAFSVFQLRINELDKSLRKLVGREIPRYVDLETCAGFVRAQTFEWTSNVSQDPYKADDWSRRTADAVMHSVVTNQGSTIAMDRFQTQSSLQDSKQVLIEQPKPPTAIELTPHSAKELVTYLRAVEQHNLKPMWGLLHQDLVFELQWYWNVRSPDIKASAPDDNYQKASVMQLIQWVDGLFAREANKPKKFRVMEFIEANPLIFNPHLDRNLHDGPFGKLLSRYNKLWRDIFAYMGDVPNEHEEEIMVRKLRKDLRMVNCKPTAKDMMLASLDQKIEHLFNEKNDPRRTKERVHVNLNVHYQTLQSKKESARKSMDYTLEALLFVFNDIITQISNVESIVGVLGGSRSSSSFSHSSSSSSDKHEHKKKKLDHAPAKFSQTTHQSTETLGPCSGCGYTMKRRDGKVICPRNSGNAEMTHVGIIVAHHGVCRSLVNFGRLIKARSTYQLTKLSRLKLTHKDLRAKRGQPTK
jgi:hypothetical protein